MTSISSERGVSAWNVPNALTTVRFILSGVIFVLIAYHSYAIACICFLVAASTDWIDGYWARKYGQVTKLGRIFDPFVDKIIICGTFIALVGIPNSGIVPWMAIVVVGRELLVTSLRGLIEGSGGDFSARALGKWKMVLQCAAVIIALITLQQQVTEGLWVIVRAVIVWSAILLTLYSGFDYLLIAARLMKSPPPESRS